MFEEEELLGGEVVSLRDEAKEGDEDDEEFGRLDVDLKAAVAILVSSLLQNGLQLFFCIPDNFGSPFFLCRPCHLQICPLKAQTNYLCYSTSLLQLRLQLILTTLKSSPTLTALPQLHL